MSMRCCIRRSMEGLGVGAAVVMCLVAVACKPEAGPPEPSAAKPAPAARPQPQSPKTGPAEGPTMAFTLTSPAFKHGERIPKGHTGEGADTSPPLEWTDPPAGTKTYALICDDPDAPVGTWDHWVIWNLPGRLRALPEGVPRGETVATLDGAAQGKNGWGTIGYRGPLPPPGHGNHHYHFRLYALDTTLDLAPGADKKALLKAMEGHILATAELVGLYSR